MSANELELKFSQQHSLDLMEAQLQHQSSAFDTIDQKAQQVINISGIVVALVAGFGTIQNTSSIVVKILVLLLLVSSAAAIVLSIKSLWLKKWGYVIKIDSIEDYEKTIEPFLIAKPDEVYWEQMMSRYVETIVRHKTILDEKTRFTDASFKCAVFSLSMTGCILIVQFFSSAINP